MSRAFPAINVHNVPPGQRSRNVPTGRSRASSDESICFCNTTSPLRGSIASVNYTNAFEGDDGIGGGASVADCATFLPSSDSKLARRIWGGHVDHDSYMKVLSRVRAQFLRPERAPSPPLVSLPTTLQVGTEENGEPVMAKFSDGIRHRSEAARRAELGLPPVTQDGTSAAVETATGSVAAPLTVVSGRFAAPALLKELESLDAMAERLVQLEAAARVHICFDEQWARQVICEMMVVHYVTYVLKPELEELQARERMVRGVVRYSEEREWHELLHESPLSRVLAEEKLALQAKRLKLERITDRTNAFSGTYPGQALLPALLCSSSTPSGVDGAVKASRTTADPATNAVGDDARIILQRYVRQKHNESSPHKASGQPTGSTGIIYRGSVHRLSGVRLPPMAGARNARRNTLGVADYIALLDEDDAQRTIIQQAEKAERRDLRRLFCEEGAGVMGWQRKRMHLERLVYWRNEREERLKAEVALLTRVPKGAMEFSPAIKLLLDMLLDEEVDARDILIASEEKECGWLRAQGATLAVQAGAELGEQVCIQMAFAQWTEACEGYAALWQELESALRVSVLRSEDRWVQEVGFTRLTVLNGLQGVDSDPAVMTAIVTVQRALRRHWRGQLGWRYTHYCIGREIQASRDTKKISEGLSRMHEYRQLLEQKKLRIAEEVEAELAAQQGKLQAQERHHRNAVISEESWTYISLARRFVEDYVTNVVGPARIACVAQERELRVVCEVSQEIEREMYIKSHKRIMDFIETRHQLVIDEAEFRELVVFAEEGTAYEALLAQELDRREEIRIEAHERVLKAAQDLVDCENEAMSAKANSADRFVAEHIVIATTAAAELTARHAAEDAARKADEDAERAEYVRLLDMLAMGSQAITGTAELRRHMDLIATARVELAVVAEKGDRAVLGDTETDERTAMMEEMNAMSSGELMIHEDRSRAARKIQATYAEHKQREKAATTLDTQEL